MKTKTLITTTLFLLMLIVSLVVTSCSPKNDMDDERYFRFKDSDKSLLIKHNYQVDQIITYRNNDGQELNFKVILNETKKSSYFTGGTFSGGSLFNNYYDNKIIRFEVLEYGNCGRHSIVNYIFSKNDNTFKNGINVPMWNVSNYTFIDEIQNPTNIMMTNYNEQTKIGMSINNHFFDKVVVIESGSDDNNQNGTYGVINRNINKVFYDYNFGIIQFNDIDGKEWKLIYPE